MVRNNRKVDEERPEFRSRATLEKSVAALHRLRNHSNKIVTETVPQILLDFSNDSSLSSDSKIEALRALLLHVASVIDSISSFPLTPPEAWNSRKKSSTETPFQFVHRVYANYI